MMQEMDWERGKQRQLTPGIKYYSWNQILLKHLCQNGESVPRQSHLHWQTCDIFGFYFVWFFVYISSTIVLQLIQNGPNTRCYLSS